MAQDIEILVPASEVGEHELQINVETENDSKTIVVPYTISELLDPPVAVITAEADAVNPGTSVVFDGSGSSQNDGEIVAYEWSNGSSEERTSKRITQADNEISLTVTGEDSQTNTVSKTIQILPNQLSLSGLELYKQVGCYAVDKLGRMTFQDTETVKSQGDCLAFTATNKSFGFDLTKSGVWRGSNRIDFELEFDYTPNRYNNAIDVFFIKFTDNITFYANNQSTSWSVNSGNSKDYVSSGFNAATWINQRWHCSVWVKNTTVYFSVNGSLSSFDYNSLKHKTEGFDGLIRSFHLYCGTSGDSVISQVRLYNLTLSNMTMETPSLTVTPDNPSKIYVWNEDITLTASSDQFVDYKWESGETSNVITGQVIDLIGKKVTAMNDMKLSAQAEADFNVDPFEPKAKIISSRPVKDGNITVRSGTYISFADDSFGIDYSKAWTFNDEVKSESSKFRMKAQEGTVKLEITDRFGNTDYAEINIVIDDASRLLIDHDRLSEYDELLKTTTNKGLLGRAKESEIDDLFD